MLFGGSSQCIITALTCIFYSFQQSFRICERHHDFFHVGMQCHNDICFPSVYHVCGFEGGKRVVIEHAADVFIEPSYYKQYLL